MSLLTPARRALLYHWTFDFTDLPGCELALWGDRVRDVVYGGAVATWHDVSGFGRNATQATGANQPLWVPDAVNGRPGLSFNGTSHGLVLPNFATGFSAGEIFVVMDTAADPPATGNGALYTWGSSGLGSHIPFADGNIYDDFGSTSRHAAGDPAPSFAVPTIYNVTSASGRWTNWMNGTQVYTTGTNSVGFGTAPAFGATMGGWYSGVIAAVGLYSRSLSAGERAFVTRALGRKYGIPVT